MPWSAPASTRRGCRARSRHSRSAARCTPSARAGCRGPRSISRRTIAGRSKWCSPRSKATCRRILASRRCAASALPDRLEHTMYEKYFQLRERPFALSPDPDYLYPSKVHQEALSYLRYGIEGHAGFVVITGEIGSGKTTMLQSLLGRLDRNTTVARVVNTMLDARELLDAIMLDFGLDPSGMSKPVLLHKLAEFLVLQRQAGRLTLLVIDEAQNLSLPALEEIRMLSNLETEKSKLIQIIMIGQPELREKLALPQLRHLRQRITVSYHLAPLDADETANYINHRLKRAAIGSPVTFPRDVTDLIHARSRGVPRIINVIADATLLFAYGIDRRDVDMATTHEALEELDATGVLASYQKEGEEAA